MSEARTSGTAQEQGAVVNCTVYKDGKRLRDIAIDDISAALREENTFVWIGLLEPRQEMLVKMQRELGLHELAIEDAGAAHQRPKLEEYGDMLFIVLHTAWIAESRLQFGETHVFVGQRFIATVRHGRSPGYAEVRQRCESTPERLANGPGYVLYAILDFVVDQYQPCMEDLLERFRRYELQMFAPASQDDDLERFYKLKHELLLLEAAVDPLSDIFNPLLRLHQDLVPEETRNYYRDVQDHVMHLSQACDRMREMIDSAMQVALAKITVRQNEVVQRLAGWGAILALPTMVFSLYGMNFRFMPELDWKWGYPIVLVGVLAGCIFLYRRLKRFGWL